MKVRVLRNLGRGLPALTEGATVELGSSEALRLIKRGLAEAVEVVGIAPEPAIKAVPDTTTAYGSKAAEADLKRYTDKQRKTSRSE